jgi:hypothetical protein
MIRLDYRIDSSWEAKNPPIDLHCADENDLLYGAFPGDITFVIDSIDLSARWGWIPVLDFSRSFLISVLDLETKPNTMFEFTDSEAVISFERNQDVVKISATYTKGIAETSFAHLLSQARQFAQRVFRELVIKYPSLQENPVFVAYQTEVNSTLSD